jgi:hypothetical protein
VTAHELLAALQARGVTLTADGGKLKARPASALDEGTLELLKQHKAALLSLLDPQRDTDAGCPEHWRHLPVLPPKGATLDDPNGRWRVKLFGTWYIVSLKPDISPTHVHVTDQDTVRRMFASLHEFYRWAWAEHYAPTLRYREVN